MLTNKQKLNPLADRYDYGWEVARRYKTDKLVADSDNEKDLQGSQKEAESRAATRRKAARGSR